MSPELEGHGPQARIQILTSRAAVLKSPPMRYITLLLALSIALALPTLSHAACKDYRADGLFYRLACPTLRAESSDREIVGEFWQRLKDLKDAAYRNDLEGYATSHDAPWALQYGSADDVWACLNSGDYRMREVLRETVRTWRARGTENGCSLLRCRASEVFGYGILSDLCGCGK